MADLDVPRDRVDQVVVEVLVVPRDRVDLADFVRVAPAVEAHVQVDLGPLVVAPADQAVALVAPVVDPVRLVLTVDRDVDPCRKMALVRIVKFGFPKFALSVKTARCSVFSRRKKRFEWPKIKALI